MEIMLIEFCPDEKTVRVVCRNKEAFVLEPMKPIYYDAMEQVARLQQNEDRKLVSADEVCKALDKQVKDHGPTPAVPQEQNGVRRKAATLYKNWKNRFLEGYWQVKIVDGKKVNPEVAREILQAIFYRHSGSNERALLRVGDTTDIKVVIGGSRAWRSIGEACKAQVKSALKHVGWDLGSAYVSRDAALTSLNAFLTSNKTLFVLVGSAGTGKSALMNSFVGSLEVPTVFLPGALYASSGLQVQSEVVEHLNAFLESGSGGDAVRRAFSVQKFHFLDEMTAVNDSCFVVVIDGVNECHGADATTEEVLRLASTAQARNTRIKFIVSCQAGRWQRLVGRVVVPPHCLFHLEEWKGGARGEEAATYSFCLAEFDDRELKAAVEAYRRRYGFRGELTEQVKEVCRLPLLLRFLAEAFADRELPEKANVASIYEAYWEYVLRGAPEGTDRFVLSVASEMRRLECTGITEDENLRNTPHFSPERLTYLMDARMLVRRSADGRDRVTFWHEKLLEYALARSFLGNEEEVLDNLEDILEEKSRFLPLWDGILQLLTMADIEFQSRFLWCVARSGHFYSAELVCEAMEQLQELSSDTLLLMEFLAESNPWDMARMILRPQLTQRFRPDELTRIIEEPLDEIAPESWAETRIYAANNCWINCQKALSSRRGVENWVVHGSARLKQIALGTLVRLPDCYRDQIAGILNAFISSAELELHQCAAWVLPRLSESECEPKRSLVADAVRGLAGSSDENVRSEAALALGRSVLCDVKSREVLTELVVSPAWERRCLAARALGHALGCLEGESWWQIARSLAADEKEEVRNNLGYALWDGIWVEGKGNRIALARNAQQTEKILESIISGSSSDIHFRFPPGTIVLDDKVRSDEATLSQDCLKRWSNSTNERLQRFATKAWSSTFGKKSADIAWHLACSDSPRVREDLMSQIGRPQERENAADILVIVKHLLGDPVQRVRVAACKALRPFCIMFPAEVVTILYENMMDQDQEVRSTVCNMALKLIEKDPKQAADIIFSIVPSLTLGSPRTAVGEALGYLLSERSGMFVFEKLVASDGEPQHHVAGVAAATAIVYESKNTQSLLRAWNHIVECATWRAQIPALGVILFELSRYSDRSFSTPSCHKMEPALEVLRVGSESHHWISRAWSAACLWKSAREREPFRSASIRLLETLSRDPDWKVRFAVETSGALELGSFRMNCMKQYRGQFWGSRQHVLSAITGAAHFFDRLAHDTNSLVVEGASLWAEALDENWSDAKNKALNERARSLLAQFYCEELQQGMAKLEWEIDAMALDHSELLISIRLLRQAETDCLVESWKTSQSWPLRQVAQMYFGQVMAGNTDEGNTKCV
ncbi:MAG: hypothetical protein WBC39_02405 [Phycisphaerae bacterium]